MLQQKHLLINGLESIVCLEKFRNRMILKNEGKGGNQLINKQLPRRVPKDGLLSLFLIIICI
jgi:hypothetical protein